MSKQVRLTLPDDLYQHLKEQAGKDDRTIVNYILHLLKQKNLAPSIYFPPGVRTPLPPNTIHTMPSPENGSPATTGRPIVTCEQKNK